MRESQEKWEGWQVWKAFLDMAHLFLGCSGCSANSLVSFITYMYVRYTVFALKIALNSRIWLWYKSQGQMKICCIVTDLLKYSDCVSFFLWKLLESTASRCFSPLYPSAVCKNFLPEFSLSLFVQSITQRLFTILAEFPMIFRVNASIADADCYMFATQRGGTIVTSVYITISRACSLLVLRLNWRVAR